MNEVIKNLKLGSIAEKFHGDVAKDWLLYSADRAGVVKHGRKVATINLDLVTNSYEIIVPECYDLVRTAHLSDFVPENYGIVVQQAQDWKGDTDADLVITGVLPRQESFNIGPRVHIPTHHRKQQTKYKKAGQ